MRLRISRFLGRAGWRLVGLAARIEPDGEPFTNEDVAEVLRASEAQALAMREILYPDPTIRSI